jgi:ribonuclease HI
MSCPPQLVLFEVELFIPSASSDLPNPDVTIHTGGFCQSNPGSGGWAAIVETKNRSVELSGAECMTTNYRIGLRSVIEAVKCVPRDASARVLSDSKYVVKGMNEWLTKWVCNDWVTSTVAPVKNRDLWEELCGLLCERQYRAYWIPGHYGYPQNERCHQLATQATVAHWEC